MAERKIGRPRRPLTPEAKTAIEDVGKVAARRREIETEYVAGILAAHHAGATNAAIADAIGVTDDSVRQLIHRHLG